MKTNHKLLPALLVAALFAVFPAARLSAQPLAAPTPVHVRPETTAPFFAILPPGAEPFTAVGVTPPAGWRAVALPGPHRVFVRNGDLAKDNTVKVGSPYLLSTADNAPMLATAEKDDKPSVKDLTSRYYTEFSLDKSIIGYIPAPVVSRAEPPAPAPVASPTPPAPETPRDLATSAPTRAPAVAANSSAGSATPDGLPQLFQGTLASTRVPLRPRRAYDYELRDTNGNRFAYLDTSRLVAPVSVESLLDRVVVVYGVARAVPGSPDLVIAAENLAAR
jgi:hypothetical protein